MGNDDSVLWFNYVVFLIRLAREVNLEDLERKAKENNMKFFEISAKTGDNVVAMFKDMAVSLQPVENSILSPPGDPANQGNLKTTLFLKFLNKIKDVFIIII